MKKTATLLMIITIFSKILGFGREITLSYFYGASNISDAYLISLTIPTVIFSFIGIGISTGYIPMYSNIQRQYGENEGNRFTNNLSNITIIICTIMIIFGLIYTEPIVKLFASGFEGETLDLSVKFTKISLFGIYFTGLMHIFTGFLQIKGNYIIPALVGFPLNFITIAAIFLSSKINILVLAIGSVIATTSQLLLLIPFIYKKGYRHRLGIDIKDEHIKKMLYLVLPIIIGASVNEINVLVDRTLASSIAVGGISALNYANKLNGFVQGLCVTPILTVMYPTISKMAAEDNIIGLKKTLTESISSVSLLVIPAIIGAMIFADPVVELLFGRGAFDNQAISMTSNALFFYSIGMLGFGLKNILSRAFYSQQDTKTPMINSAIAVLLNIILNIILSKYLGIGGLALATSISALFSTVLLFISFRKKVGSFGMKNITISIIKTLFASLIMGLVAKMTYNILFKYMGVNLTLIAAIIIGAAIYFVIIYFMKIDEVDSMVKAVKRKLGRS